MIPETQDKIPSLEWLYAQGWTLRGAAQKLNVDPSHLRRVLDGERISKRLIDRVLQLPKQRLVLRRLKSSKHPR